MENTVQINVPNGARQIGCLLTKKRLFVVMANGGKEYVRATTIEAAMQRVIRRVTLRAGSCVITDAKELRVKHG